MKNIKRMTAALAALSIAATMSSCGTPTIGSGSSTALTVDGYDIKAGIFIFYTMQSYNDAKSQLAEDMDGATPTLEQVEDAQLDGVDSTQWIQDKATQYCSDFVAIQKEFDKIGGELSAEDLDEIDTMVQNIVAQDTQYHYISNGISEDSLREIASVGYKSDFIFNYYYGTDSEQGMSEDELKDYFNNNFARVKYVNLSYLDADGNALDESGKKKIRDMANDYAKRVNSKSSTEEKLFEMNDVISDYNEYVASLSAVEEETETEAVTTTTTVAEAETTTTTTTTTGAHDNERIIQKPTTASSEKEKNESAETTTQSASQKSAENLNNYIFDKLPEAEYNKAVVLDDEENDSIYVIIRADLKERLNDDDLWVDSNIEYLQSLNFSEDFTDYMKKISDAYEVDRNNSAYSRYKPFDDDIVLE